VQRTTTRSASVLSLPVMADFRREYNCLPLPSGAGREHTLLDCAPAWSSYATALACDCDCPTFRRRASHSSFGILQQNGLVCVIADPREMEYRNGKLFAGGVHVTLIYKRVLIDELVKECGSSTP